MHQEEMAKAAVREHITALNEEEKARAQEKKSCFMFLLLGRLRLSMMLGLLQ